jgi:hypothetical protein
MKSLAIGLSAILLLSAPALAQDPSPVGGTQQNDPGTGGTSKPGVQGDVGGKNGPAARDAGAPAPDAGTSESSTGAAGSDNSKVPGLPGNKSGPTQKPKQ